jgi:hypothetical protein
MAFMRSPVRSRSGPPTSKVRRDAGVTAAARPTIASRTVKPGQPRRDRLACANLACRPDAVPASPVGSDHVTRPDGQTFNRDGDRGPCRVGTWPGCSVRDRVGAVVESELEPHTFAAQGLHDHLSDRLRQPLGRFAESLERA